MFTNLSNVFTKSKKYTAFTLAEVLITLAVIGVVAAISIPSLQANIQNKQNITAWKKAYAEIGQALDQYKSENGGTYSDLILWSSQRSNYHTLKKYFNISKDCTYYNTATEPCIRTTGNPYSDINGDPVDYHLFDDGQFVTTSGMNIYFEQSSNITTPRLIFIDTNSHAKGPNQLGKDLFGLRILEDKYIPIGSPEFLPDSCESTGTTHMGYNFDGAGCSAEYLYK